MALQIGPLAHNVAIVEKDGRPTPEFQRAFLSLSRIAAGTAPEPDTYIRSGLMTGWASATGTASRAAFATYTAPTISNPPTQAQVQAMATHIQVLSRTLKAIIDDLKTLQAFNN